jgi:hypothetical protein
LYVGAKFLLSLAIEQQRPSRGGGLMLVQRRRSSHFKKRFVAVGGKDILRRAALATSEPDVAEMCSRLLRQLSISSAPKKPAPNKSS